MKRLLSAVRWEMRLQFRHGFYYAALFVVVVMVGVLRPLRLPNWELLFPAVILQSVLIGTYYFMAGLVLLEKGEGTLEGLVVTPLRQGEYLAAKVVTLTGLAMVENMVLVTAVYGRLYNSLLLLAGVALLGSFYALFGFITVARYDSINSFLFPSFFYTAVLTIPLVDYFGLWTSPLIYLHPMQAALLLLKAAFQPVAAWQLAYGILYGALWIGLAYEWSRRVFYRFVILQPGVSR